MIYEKNSDVHELIVIAVCGGGRYEESDYLAADDQGASIVNIEQAATELNSLPEEKISVNEERDLIFLREEEKVARDAYLKIFDVNEIDIFMNIADVEQSHTDAVKILLDKYLIADPVTDDTVGLFTNPDLQAIYDDLVSAGSQSLEAAIKVGLEVEELDIKDIRIFRGRADNEDILLVYESLEKDSRNHLRSFWKLLTDKGYCYVPKHLSQEAFYAIVNSEMETAQ